MRKIFLVLVAVLLIASTAQAVEWTQALTADLAAQSKGRSVTSDSSVVMRVWYTGTSATAGVGVSTTSAILLYSDTITETATTVSSGTYATIGAAVDYINSLAGWNATVGEDSYRAMLSTFYLPENWAAPGDRVDNAYTVQLDCSTATFMSCGVLNSVGKTGRIKEYKTSLWSADDNMTIDIYDGDTSVYHSFIPTAAYVSTTAHGSSLDTVVLTNSGKGLAGTKNTPLCLVIDSSGALDTNALAKSHNNISIVYDRLAE